MITTDESTCPNCGGMLKYYDSVPRMVKTKFGKSYWITLRRVRCIDCKRKHRVIPELLLPYKHYEAYIINGFISGNLSSDDLEYEDYPCEETIKNWKKAHKKHSL